MRIAVRLEVLRRLRAREPSERACESEPAALRVRRPRFCTWKDGRFATWDAASRSFSTLAVEMPLMPSSLRFVMRRTPSAVVTPDSLSFLMSEVCTPKLTRLSTVLCVVSMDSPSSSVSSIGAVATCENDKSASNRE